VQNEKYSAESQKDEEAFCKTIIIIVTFGLAIVMLSSFT